MRKAFSVLAVLVVAAAFVGSASSARQPSLKLSACVNAASPQQLVVTQTWWHAGPADFAGQYTIVFNFYLNGVYDSSIDNNYIAAAGDLVSGTQTDTFNPFIGTAWNDWTRVDATYVVGGTTTVSGTVNKPKNGWRACK